MPDLQNIPRDGSRQDNAEIPIIHRQTLGYRLVKMSGVKRRDLNSPKDRFDLYMGLLIMDIID